MVTGKNSCEFSQTSRSPKENLHDDENNKVHCVHFERYSCNFSNASTHSTLLTMIALSLLAEITIFN